MDALSHFAHQDPTCPFCSCMDSKDHRVFHCQGLEDLRRKHKETIKWLHSQPQAVLHFGLIPDDAEAVLLRQEIFQGGFDFVMPANDSSAVVYTDGSCFGNTSWEHAFAGAAVIRVVEDYKWELVERAVLPSPDHSPYRAECFAVLLALQHFTRVHLHTDCEAVVNEVLRILQDCHMGRSPEVRNHSDIWNPIVWHLKNRKYGDVHITKVKAHVQWQPMSHGQCRLHAFFNSAADNEAKKAVAADNFDLWQTFDKMLDQHKSCIKGVRRYHDFLCEIHEKSFKLKPKVREVEVQPDFSDLWSMQGPGLCFDGPTSEDIAKCPYGTTFASRVLTWWAQLRWF